MKYSFTCYGHKNITAKHKTTLEFTKDAEIGLEGDCIVGVRADFSLEQLKKFIKSAGINRKITITIETVNEEGNNKDYNKDETNNNPNNKIIRNEISNIDNKNDMNTNKINNDSNNKIIYNEKNNINNQIKNNNNKNTINNEKNNKIIEKINAEINPGFNSDKEMIIRKSDFISERTFVIRADKAAFELNKDLVEFLRERSNKIRVIIEKRIV